MTTENKKTKFSKSLVSLALVSLSAILLVYACQKPNNESFTDESEIVRLMENNLDAREIFETSVFPSDSVLVDSSSSVLRRLSFTEKTRSPVTAFLRPRPVEIENFGLTFVAQASVSDKFFGDYLQKLDGQPDLSKLWDDRLDRKALLFKLQDDNAPYLGWELVGYDTGKPLALIGADVTIRVFPTNGGVSRIISNKSRENLPPDLSDFTLLIHVDALRSGERVEIETLRQKLSIFARTAQGFRQLVPTGPVGGRYKYSFIVPPSDINRFFHLMTFQSGPEIFIDSLWNFFLDTVKIDTLDPPETTLIIDSIAIDSIAIDSIETLFFVDTIVDSFNFITEPDSTFLDTNHIFNYGDIWTFPYSVR